METKTKRHLGLVLGVLFAISACQSATPSVAPSSAASEAPSAAPSESAPAPSESAAPSALAPDPAEAVIQNIEPNASITVWTFWLSPTFDTWIADTIDRFKATYPGVEVKWEDHQATFQDDLKNSFAAGNAPDVINLSVGEGWVSDYATRNLLLPLDGVSQEVKDSYFEGLWKSQNVDGKNYQFPFYQGVSVELINKRHFEAAGLDPAAFPTKVEELPGLCQTLKDKANVVCDLRLTVNDLLAQMVYEGNVKVIADDGSAFTFDSPDAVSWLQMYVDMVAAGTVDNTALTTKDDRVGLLIFSAGQAPFYQTGPNLIREVKANNAQLYEDLAVVPAPVGKSGVIGKGLMGMSVKADTKFPNASMALAQFFTNARTLTELSKQSAVYPSSPKAFEDPYFSASSPLIEDSARGSAKDAISKYADIVPTIPAKADVNAIVLTAVEKALFGGVAAQQALTEAVAEANKLLD
ncbi:MAG TPA: extracellular solute-binding protein [Candidatus Limnocylindrales bacterium]|nr:extracellular solute-binding protein [Candidatus Limnocylindrales bacterium]